MPSASLPRLDDEASGTDRREATPGFGAAAAERDRRDGDATQALRVLSVGFTVDLWQPPAQAMDDTRTRLDGYSRQLGSYDVVALTRTRLAPSRLQLGPSFVAHAAYGRSWPAALASAFRVASAVIRERRVDLIQAQDPVLTGCIATILGRRYGLPVNVCVYGANPWDAGWLGERPRRHLQAPFARFVLRRAAGVQVDGEATERVLLEHEIAADRIARKPMIPSIVPELFEARPDRALRDRLTERGRWPHVVLFVGRLARQKNLPFLVDILAEVKRKGLPVRLAVAGSGTIENEVRASAARLGVDDRVLWLGAQPHAAIGPLMASSDLVVLPSLYEGFARVLIEAAAAGRPIVCSAVSGADEAIVHGETGFVCPIGDRPAFVAAVTRLVERPELAEEMGRAARRHIAMLVERFGDLSLQVQIWERLVQRAHELRDLRAGRRPGDRAFGSYAGSHGRE